MREYVKDYLESNQGVTITSPNGDTLHNKNGLPPQLDVDNITELDLLDYYEFAVKSDYGKLNRENCGRIKIYPK